MTQAFPTFKQVTQLSYEEVVDTWPEIFKSYTLPLESDTHFEENGSQTKSVQLTNQEYSGLSESEYYETRYENYIQDRFCRYGY